MSNHSLRIVYMGTPDFAVLPLKKLLDAGHQVVGVVTNPDKPAGRGQKIQESAVKKFAQQAGLKILQPEKFRDEQFLRDLEQLKADLQVVVAFKMLPEVVWNMPPLGTVNLHASLLPDYRGAAPINWAVINGEKYSGVSTFLLKHEIDTGCVIFQEKVEISDEMTAGDLHDELMEVGASLLLKTVDAIEQREYPLIEQDTLLGGRESKHAPKIFKEDMKIRWTDHMEQVHNHIRGLSPFPGAWTELLHSDSDKVVLMKIFKTEKVEQNHQRQIGEVETDGKSKFSVFVSGGKLNILDLQLSGKKRMKVDEFLRGFPLHEYRLLV